MTTWLKLYENWTDKLAALEAEYQKHDLSPEGESAYEIAFAEAKQAYDLLCMEDARRIDEQLKAVGV